MRGRALDKRQQTALSFSYICAQLCLAFFAKRRCFFDLLACVDGAEGLTRGNKKPG